MDIKNSATSPTAVAHRAVGRQAGQRHRTRTPGKTLDANGNSHVGHSYPHNAVDDHSRLTLPNEKKATAVAFWQRAQAFFTAHGITVARVLTDNGSCYKSRLWREALATAGISHKRTRPYRPETERREAFPQWLHTYNHHRGHTALAAYHPPAAFLTSQGITASPRRASPPAPESR